MSVENVSALITKAVADPVFANALDSNFAATVASHNISLTDDESKALGQVKWAQTLSPDALAAGTWVHIYKTAADVK